MTAEYRLTFTHKVLLSLGIAAALLWALLGFLEFASNAFAANNSSSNNSSNSSSSSSQQNCDENAVIRCGVSSPTNLQKKYGNRADVQALYRHFGISKSDINQIDTTMQQGYVTKGGRVVVDGKTVATNAMTVGRQNMPGSTKMTAGGTTFYMRPPSVSFASSRLDAYVVMNNNQFAYAILTSCGNPVKATPVQQKQPTPAPAPAPQPTPAPAPAPQPAPAASASAVAVASANVVVVNEQKPAPTPPPVGIQQPTPQPAPAPAPAPAPKPMELPHTGMENVLGVFAVTSLMGTGLHLLFTRRKLPL